ncbi:hypothetical protein ATCC90586_007507 [Pythium insidiosum]|nr:hypothetical protein ATCC90586_007507 [Pythium insidiosum]
MALPRAFQLVLCVALSFSALAAAGKPRPGNKYPIILLHGFSGWGRDELGGSKYWGGLHGDWQEQLKQQGFDVRTAVVGPFSSNWDRACELYAYIKGGTVNYGPNHARVHGHNVTGRTFPGIFPEWGEVINGEVQKVHIVGHSMGGQTARMLAQLLEDGGRNAPIAEDPASHELFAGGKQWIQSITTVATPNQGTLLADGFDTFGDLGENLIGVVVASLHALGDGVAKLYDVKLDQWNLAPRRRDEKLKDYVKRAFNSPALRNAGRDLCAYSLSTAGAKEDSKWVKTLPSVYYYSITNYDTFRLGAIELPRPHSMLPMLQPISLFLGSTFALKRGYSREWQTNDGVVNLPSMLYDGKSEVVEGVGDSQPGRWHHVALLKAVDHEAIRGVKPFVNVMGVYAAQFGVLYELPTTTYGQRRLRGVADSHRHSDEVLRRLQDAVEQVNAMSDIAVACANPRDDSTRLLCEQHRSPSV